MRIVPSDWMPLHTGLTDGQHVFAIGDVHGRAANLSALLDFLGGNTNQTGENTLLFLGDLHDRGVDDLGAMDLAVNAPDREFSSVICLMGNHEQLLKLTLLGRDSEVPLLWKQNGGGSLMRQLGLQQELGRLTCAEFANRLEDALGTRRAGWLANLQSHFKIGNLLFVHAGINHQISLDEHFSQHWSVLHELHWSWIRSEFLGFPVMIPNLTVIHGHTPVRRNPVQQFAESDFFPHYQRDGKINLDGGSFISGCVIGAQFTKSAWRLAAAVGPPSS